MLRVLPFLYALFAAKIRTGVKSERGATAVEYGLLVALIAAIIVGVVGTLGQEIDGAFQTVVNAIS